MRKDLGLEFNRFLNSLNVSKAIILNFDDRDVKKYSFDKTNGVTLLEPERKVTNSVCCKQTSSLNSKDPRVDLVLDKLGLILKESDTNTTKTIGIMICGSTKRSFK